MMDIGVTLAGISRLELIFCSLANVTSDDKSNYLTRFGAYSALRSNPSKR